MDITKKFEVEEELPVEKDGKKYKIVLSGKGAEGKLFVDVTLYPEEPYKTFDYFYKGNAEAYFGMILWANKHIASSKSLDKLVEDKIQNMFEEIFGKWKIKNI